MASLIFRTANVAETPGTAPVVKKAAGNVVGASEIVGVAKVVETPGTATVAARITVEASNESEDLNEIVEFEEATQFNCFKNHISKFTLTNEGRKLFQRKDNLCIVSEMSCLLEHSVYTL